MSKRRPRGLDRVASDAFECCSVLGSVMTLTGDESPSLANDIESALTDSMEWSKRPSSDAPDWRVHRAQTRGDRRYDRGPSVWRDDPGRRGRRGLTPRLQPVPLRQQLRRKALALAKSLDFDRNRVDGELDPFEARVVRRRAPLRLSPRAMEPLSPAVDGGPEGNRSRERAADYHSGFSINHRISDAGIRGLVRQSSRDRFVSSSVRRSLEADLLYEPVMCCAGNLRTSEQSTVVARSTAEGTEGHNLHADVSSHAHVGRHSRRGIEPELSIAETPSLGDWKVRSRRVTGQCLQSPAGKRSPCRVDDTHPDQRIGENPRSVGAKKFSGRCSIQKRGSAGAATPRRTRVARGHTAAPLTARCCQCVGPRNADAMCWHERARIPNEKRTRERYRADREQAYVLSNAHCAAR